MTKNTANEEEEEHISPYWGATLSEEVAKEWTDHRKKLGINTKSEYVRVMVAAGKKDLSLVNPTNSGGSESLRDRILDVLDDEEYKTFQEIRDELVEQLEAKINEELAALDDAERVEMSPQLGWRK